MTEPQQRLVVFVSGRVQGVGFRWWTRARALELGLVGRAANLPDGRVCVTAEGPRAPLELLLAALASTPGPPGRPGRVTAARAAWSPGRRDLVGFVEA